MFFDDLSLENKLEPLESQYIYGDFKNRPAFFFGEPPVQIGHPGPCNPAFTLKAMHFIQNLYIFFDFYAPLCICTWYRPPCSGETNSITSLRGELQVHSSNCLGAIIVRDMNVHHTGWLKYSSHISPEGKSLSEECCIHGLK